MENHVTIYKDELIEALKTDAHYIMFDDYGNYTPDGLLLLEIISRLKPVDEQKKWIPCSEKMPDEDKEVLTTVYFKGLKQTHSTGWNDHIKPNYYVDLASHIDGNWSSYSDDYKVAKDRHKTIAWMSLPEPYKGA